MTSVLVLAGTAEAAALVRRLHSAGGVEVVASFAGRTARPAALPAPVRSGGFGGVDGLVRELRREGHDLLVDATHPFAARMSANAFAAASRLGLAHLRLLRPPWRPAPGDAWHEVGDMGEAAARVAALGCRRVFLATGRGDVDAFAGLAGTRFVLRSVDPPGPLPLRSAEVVLGRGPFTIDGEAGLLRRHGIDLVIARNSGAEATAAKLAAARRLGIPVVMLRRPPAPPGERVESVDGALAWVRARL